MLPVATILHPTDFSEHSEFAFRLACALARDYNARLVLLHVALPPIMVYGEAQLPWSQGPSWKRQGKNCTSWRATLAMCGSNRRSWKVTLWT